MVRLRLPPHIQTLAEDYTSRLQQAQAEGKVVVLDLETDGLEGNTIWVVGMLSVGRNASPTMMEPRVAATEIPKMVREGYFFIIHNAKFDVVVLQKHDIYIPWEQVLDTMLLSYVRNPSLDGGHSLDNLGDKMDYRKALVDAGLLDSKAPKGAEYRVPPNPIMHLYCAKDLEVTRQVYDENIAMIERDYAAWCLFAGVEMQFLPIIVDMEDTGLYLDIPRARTVCAEWTERRYELAEKAQSLAGFVPGKVKNYKKGYHKSNGVITYDHTPLLPFNPASGAHIAFVLQRMGWVPEELTATGKPKTDIAVLNTLRGEYELVDLLLEIGRLDKLTTMVESYIEKAESNEGWVRGNFNQALTITGRLSSSNPNLQNIPGRGEDGELIRSLFIAPPGCDLVRSDLSNIEARALAHFLSYFEDDHGLSATFRRGDDFHQYNADCWGCTRSEAKTLLFASLYGAGPSKVGGGDEQRGNELLDGLDRNMPSINRLKRRVWDNTKRNKQGLIHTWFGRRLVYPDIRSKNKKLSSRAKRQVFNAMLQGTSADILKMIAVTIQREVSPRYNDVRICAQVHDEGIWVVPSSHTEKFLLDIEEAFSYDYLSNTPIKGEALAGQNWNDAHS